MNNDKGLNKDKMLTFKYGKMTHVSPENPIIRSHTV